MHTHGIVPDPIPGAGKHSFKTLPICCLERDRALRGTTDAKRKEVQPMHLQLRKAPAYHTIPVLM